MTTKNQQPPEYVSDMSYEDALKVMQQARIRTPAIVELRKRIYVFSKTDVLGSGKDLESALEDAGLLPLPDRRGQEAVLFANNGIKVYRGPEWVCDARTRNMAHRIANALNAYTPNKDGY
jgi:hypothetical protein